MIGPRKSSQAARETNWRKDATQYSGTNEFRWRAPIVCIPWCRRSDTQQGARKKKQQILVRRML